MKSVRQMNKEVDEITDWLCRASLYLLFTIIGVLLVKHIVGLVF